MILSSGSRLGPYEIVDQLGAGGMGEVYRARDTRLDRTVAIKVLSVAFGENTDLKARFEREARSISQLQHPYICTLYDVGHQDGIDFLIMEYLEGETLADRLHRGALPINEALRIGIQIAEALDKAHRAGIVHRDLKPGNIMLTKSNAKLLDFGLAKPAVSTGNALDSNVPLLSAALTMTSPSPQGSPLTTAGTIVGTIQYMSPEQIEGKAADSRSDIFSFGAVLYEMVTGRRAFQGKSQLSVASAILEKEPEPISILQPLTPPSLERVVRRALGKDPDARWQSMTDLRSELEWIAESGTKTQPAALARAARVTLWIAATALLLLLVTSLALRKWNHTEPAPLMSVSILPPANGSFVFYGDYGSEPILSPDGKHLAFAANVNGEQAIYVRDLESASPRMLPGTKDARFPFWSPDGKRIGYFSGGRMMKMDLATGTSTEIVAGTVEQPRGASWGSNGTVLFAPTFRSPIYAVSENGGIARAITQMGPQHTTHRWPVLLPDGEHFIYLAANHRLPTDPHTGLYVASVRGGEAKWLASSLCNASVVGSRLLYCQGDKLYAQDLDLKNFQLQRQPHLLASTVAADPSTWRMMFSASAGGLMVYAPSTSLPGSNLIWFDGSGKQVGKLGDSRDYMGISASRDGSKVAAEISDPTSNIAVAQARSNTFKRLTFGGMSGRQPAISRDGAQVAFSTDINGKMAVVRKNTSGFGEAEILVEDVGAAANDWSEDGRYLLLQVGEPGQAFELAVYDLKARKRIPILRVPGQQAYDGAFSPDMNYFLYTSTENGLEEVFVSPLAITTDSGTASVKPTARWQVSNGGGLGQWSHDGKQIFYISVAGNMMAVPIKATATSFESGSPRELFSVPVKNMTGMPYDVTTDGRFLVNIGGKPTSSPLTLITNWQKMLK